MITNKNFGTYGRLGNHIWQYAALYGIGKKNGLPIAIPFNTELDEKLFRLKNVNRLKNFNQVKKSIFFDSNDFNEQFFQVEDWTDFNGLFQNLKYFDFCLDEIKYEFEFRDTLPQIDYVSVSIRRGDYVTRGLYVLPQEFYFDSMKLFPDEKFLFFSDDIEWVKENFKGPNIIYHDNINPYYDLAKLSSCKSHIIANSTWSWWGAFLSTGYDLRVVANEKWFGGGAQINETFPENWILIKGY